MFHLLLLPFVISPLSVEHTSTGVSAMKIENRRVLEVEWKDSKMLGKKPLPPKNKEPYWNPPPNVSPYKGKKIVALTFDDGPNGKTTERLLDILKKEGVHATFFLVGSRVEGQKSVVKRESDEGHEIGNHSWSHPRLTKLSPERVEKEFSDTQEAIEKVTGKSPYLIRVPYGLYNGTVEDIAKHPFIQWDVDSKDWKTRNVATLSQKVVNSVKPGSIVLLHDLHPWVVDAVPTIITSLKAQGYEFVTVGELIGYNPSQAEKYQGVVYNRMPE